MNLFEIPEGLVLAVHFLWILWVILGGLVTRHRAFLRWLHILSLIYGIGVEIGPWPCPLTLAEQWLRRRAGMPLYCESFLVHYLQGLVYPEVPQALLMWCASAVCVFNLGLHARWFWRDRRPVSG